MVVETLDVVFLLFYRTVSSSGLQTERAGFPSVIVILAPTPFPAHCVMKVARRDRPRFAFLAWAHSLIVHLRYLCESSRQFVRSQRPIACGDPSCSFVFALSAEYLLLFSGAVFEFHAHIA